MKRWSFELTARLWPSPKRRKKLADRRAKALVDERVRDNWDKTRKVLPVIKAANIWTGLREAKY